MSRRVACVGYDGCQDTKRVLGGVLCRVHVCGLLSYVLLSGCSLCYVCVPAVFAVGCLRSLYGVSGVVSRSGVSGAGCIMNVVNGVMQ